ncbi:hypothetical protein HED49_22785 [Ochrobactrum daejeonense]|nr:hypothetical protein [Brucella daejeonensis]NKB80123.1 hypothetical protein [Brucella daejeonensis]
MGDDNIPKYGKFHFYEAGLNEPSEIYKRMKALEAKLAAAEKALEPFAAIKTADGPEGTLAHIPDGHGLMFNIETWEPYFTVGDVRKARAALRERE